MASLVRILEHQYTPDMPAVTNMATSAKLRANIPRNLMHIELNLIRRG